MHAAKPAEHLEQHVDPLARNRARTCSTSNRRGAELPIDFGVGLRVGRRRAAGCAPRYATLVRDGSTRPVAIRSCRVASLMHATCDAREMPSSTCPARSRDGIETRRRISARGLERVGVVAGHDRALRRQHSYQMRIAVIDDVKDVEVAAARREASADSPTAGRSAGRRAARGCRRPRPAAASIAESSADTVASRRCRRPTTDGSISSSMSATRSMLCQPSSRRSQTMPTRTGFIGVAVAKASR